jgi:hypothetical protein
MPASYKRGSSASISRWIVAGEMQARHATSDLAFAGKGNAAST